MCRQSWSIRTDSSAMKVTTEKVVPKSARPGMTDSATTPAPVMDSYPVCPAGRGNTAKNVSNQLHNLYVLQLSGSLSISSLFLVITVCSCFNEFLDSVLQDLVDRPYLKVVNCPILWWICFHSVLRPLLFIIIIMVSAYREKCISLISAVASMWVV